jgi:hypothetical protein
MTHIFLDNDDVLAGFNEYTLQLWGKYSHELTDEALWDHVETEPNFWLDMPVKDGAFELFEMVKDHKVTILTGCPARGFDLACEHKPQWVAKHLGTKYGIDIPVITCRGIEKPLHMKNPGDILVDDYLVNIERWREAGGIGIWYQDPATARAELAEVLSRLSHQN